LAYSSIICSHSSFISAGSFLFLTLNIDGWFKRKPRYLILTGGL